MSERYAFRLRYDDEHIRSSVTRFMVRSLFWQNTFLTLLPLAVIVMSCGMLFISGDWETAIELFLFSSILLVIFAASGWRMHLRILRQKVEAMRGTWPMARICDDGVSIDGPGPTHLLEWKSIRGIWPTRSAWLLILDTEYFVALPVAAAPYEALEFLQFQVSPHSSRNAQK